NKYVDDEKLEGTASPPAEKLAALRTGATTLRELALTLGLFRQPPQALSTGGDELAGKLIELLITVRSDARKAKNFAMADSIRKGLADLGVTLEDRPGGTDWTISK
ncbi:MAG: cysteine--tRNA ligase, partial [Thermoguttaceae bacterium]|nr:cysteine--tRNA ligase [Thermoguttaceae bacterium]